MSLKDAMRRWRERATDPATGLPYEREALAEAAGVSYKTLESIENGRTKSIGPAEASRFAKALGVPVGEVLRAMGYAVEGPELTPLESEMVQILRRIPAEIQDDFLEATRRDAIGAIAMYRRLTGARRGS